MGTLTADVPRLAEHCLHKLPSSCRLTATPLCCACYDRRPHTATYSVYVDGVGFVQRGTRWQNYCWFCKTFWENRVAASSIPTTQTRIPEEPDQTEFVARWFEFYQGFRTVKHNDGREDRVAVVGEPLKEVPPGHLPRTVDELRRGTSLSSVEARLSSIARRPTTRQIEVSQPTQSLEETLDDLLQEAIAEGEEETRAQEPEVPSRVAPSPARPTSTRRRRPPEIQTIIRPSHASSRMRERLVRIFGTPEEIQSDEYVSPIAGMFNRAWERHRRFQELRRAQEGTGEPPVSTWWVLENETFPGVPTSEEEALIEARRLGMYRRLAAGEGQGDINPPLYESLFGPGEGHYDRPAAGGASNAQPEASQASHETQEGGSGSAGLGTLVADDTHTRYAPQSVTAFTRQANMAAVLRQRMRHVNDNTEFPGLDGDDRPEPLDDDQLTVKLECKICLSQLADTACLPCGHLSMCSWCADQAIPVRENDRTRPRNRHSRCPVCRKGVKQRVKIYMQ